MTDARRLLALNRDLVVWTVPDGDIAVGYQYGYVKDEPFLVGTFGTGDTFEAACSDYLSKISGKTLVFDPPRGTREEIKVL